MSPPQAAPRRTEWVDVARFTAMVFIILMHLPLSAGTRAVTETIYQSAWVYLFFFLAGYFSGQKTPSFRQDVKRMTSLLVPYLIWSLIFFFSNYGREMSAIWQTQGWPAWMEYLIRRGLGIGGDPLYLPLWFLRDLALFSLLRTPFLKIPFWGKLSVTGFLLVCPFGMMIPHEWRFVLPDPIGLRYYCLGLLLAPVVLEKLRDRLLSLPALILLLSAIASVIQYRFPACQSTLFTCLGIMGLLSTGILICNRFPGTGRFLASWNTSIFFIYLSHVFLLTRIQWIAPLLGIPPFSDTVLILVILPILLFLPWGIYHLLKVCFPSSLPWIAGGKG